MMNTVRVPLRPRNYALISHTDCDIVMGYDWRIWTASNGLRYAVATVKRDDKRCTVYMHRLILGVTLRTQLVDHKDGNGLNNTRENLRECTQAQNNWNASKTSEDKSSKFKGVSLLKRGRKRWHASITHLGKNISLGVHETEEQAAKAYDKKARELRPEFARINF